MTDDTPVQEAERKLEITRVLDAPREVVFAAWTDPDQLARWWGPEGFDTPRESVVIDLRAGGRHDKVMVVASAEIAAGMQVELGTEFPDRAEIVEVTPPELLVLRSEPQPEIGLEFPTVTRIEFSEEGEGRTRVTITDGPYTATMAPNAEAGWSGSLDKLARLLPGLR